MALPTTLGELHRSNPATAAKIPEWNSAARQWHPFFEGTLNWQRLYRVTFIVSALLFTLATLYPDHFSEFITYNALTAGSASGVASLALSLSQTTATRHVQNYEHSKDKMSLTTNHLWHLSAKERAPYRQSMTLYKPYSYQSIPLAVILKTASKAEISSLLDGTNNPSPSLELIEGIVKRLKEQEKPQTADRSLGHFFFRYYKLHPNAAICKALAQHMQVLQQLSDKYIPKEEGALANYKALQKETGLPFRDLVTSECKTPQSLAQ